MTVSSDYTEQLWQACAGLLVTVPKVNQRVWYFPQGHMEQVAAASMQDGADQQASQTVSSDHPVPSQILCRIVHLSLSAEPDTDEVYAQLSLLPEKDEVYARLSLLPELCQTCDLTASSEEAAPACNHSVRLFTKILTASDTSTHGGFSVLRKHAEECLPSLDMSSEIPTQELTATDIHGQEWKFRHTYRGRPQRHLLTTGWSYFISQKRLVAGDAVIFLRGEDGKMRVGILRAKRQQSNPTFNVLTSHSMRMGVIATAACAFKTQTMFGVYYKPRSTQSPFVIPVETIAGSLSKTLIIGTRFKMRFESEDASERSFSGTITDIADVDPAWPNSKWRSLIVNWDEMTALGRPDRVSPWEIEVCVSVPNSTSAPKNKRVCSSNNMMHAQGWINETNISSTESWIPQQHSLLRKFLGGLPVTSVDDGRRSMEVSYGMDGQAHMHDQNLEHQPRSLCNVFTPPEVAPKQSFTIMKKAQLQSHGGAGGSEIVQTHMHARQPLSTANISSSWIAPSAVLSHHGIGNSVSSSFSPWEQHCKEKLPDMNGCKLFGYHLTELPSSTLKKRSDEENAKLETSCHGPNLCTETVCAVSQSKSGCDHEKSDNTVQKKSTQPVRSCTKVIMKGTMVGRGVDLSKFDNYKMLMEELEGMFHIEGELSNPERGWQVAYSDDEGDMMHVGDDPWMEFCSMVRKIYIFSPEERQSADEISIPKSDQSKRTEELFNTRVEDFCV